MKKFIFNRSFLHLALLLGLSNAYATNDVAIAENPLADLQDKNRVIDSSAKQDAVTYPPNLYLALSVEFPTAGAAYNSEGLALDSIAKLQKEYIGYFDNKKCYVFDTTELAFIPNSQAQMQPAGYLGCNNGDETNEFSGNAMNFLTMSAIDILRYTLTGGNRAKGMGIDDSAYTSAESGYNNKGVYIRHSKVTNSGNNQSVSGFPGKNSIWRITKETRYGYIKDGKYSGRYINFASANMMAAIPHLVPHRYIPDVINSNPDYKFGSGWYIYQEGDYKNVASEMQVGNLVSLDAQTAEKRKSDSEGGRELHFQVRDFAVLVGRRIENRGRLASPDAVRPYVNSNLDYGFLPVVVNACNDTGNGGGGRDEDANKCSANGKSIGIIQRYLGQVNLAAFGYPKVESDKKISGGVLKAPLSDLSSELTEDGSFVINPGIPQAKDDGTIEYKTSYTAGGKTETFANSGVINYLNKFGDFAGYKESDDMPILYYDMSRYIRGLKDISATHANSLSAGYSEDFLKEMKDGFPSIEYSGEYKDDPLVLSSGMSKETYTTMRNAVANKTALETYENTLSVSQQESYRNAACRVNQILMIGDTYTQQNFYFQGKNTGIYGDNAYVTETRDPIKAIDEGSANAQNSTMEVQNYAKAALGGRYTAKWGSPLNGNSHPFGVGVAYWLRANDNRKDLMGEQRASNFIIDVLESYEQYKGRKGNNQYFEMAKWGGMGVNLDRNRLQPLSDENNSGTNLTANSAKGPFTNKITVANNDLKDRFHIDTTGNYYVNAKNYVTCRSSEDDSNLHISSAEKLAMGLKECTYTVTENNEEVKKQGEYFFTDSASKTAFNDLRAYYKAMVQTVVDIFGYTGEETNFPYNFAPGNNPEALEAALNAMFVSATQSEEVDAESMDLVSYAQSPAATANVGGISICESTSDDDCTMDNGVSNKVISGVYDLDSYSGDIFINSIYQSGGKTTAVVDSRQTSLAESIQSLVAGNSRKLFSYGGKAGSQLSFTSDNASSFGLSKSVVEYVNGTADDRKSKKDVKVTVSSSEVSYPNYIGTIVNSNILEVPELKVGDSIAQTYGRRANDISCKVTVARNRLLGVASNDGIYHLMSLDLTNYGKIDEVYGYIPSTAWSKLADYAADTKHQYINDGLSSYIEFCDGDRNNATFKSYVIGTTGRGGTGIYAIDVSGDNPQLAWEIDNRTTNFAGLGYTIPQISTSFLADGTPILVVASGYNSGTENGYIYIINAKDGSRIKTFTLGTSGVGSPFVYDHDADGILDAIYAGDFAGNLWKIAYGFDFDAATNNITERWSSADKLFQPEGRDTIENSTLVARPITIAPYAARNGEDVYVIFATGHSLHTDNGGLAEDVQNYGYGIFEPNFSTDHKDGASPLPANMSQSLIDTFGMPSIDSDLVQNIGTSNNRYYNAEGSSSTNVAMDSSKNRGWRVTFDVGYTATLSEVVQRKVAVFMVTQPEQGECEKDYTAKCGSKDSDGYAACVAEEQLRDHPKSEEELCAIRLDDSACLTGTTALVAVDVKTGSQYVGKSLFDTTGDNEIHSASECEAFTGDAYTDCIKKVDTQASVIYIPDFLSVGGGTLTPMYSSLGDGTTKKYNGAVLTGYGIGVTALPINSFGISSFIRNSLREIRR